MSRTGHYKFVNRRVFGERLKKAVEESGISIEDIATDIEMARSSVYEWMLGMHFPTVDVLVGLADELDVSIDWLFGRSEVMR